MVLGLPGLVVSREVLQPNGSFKEECGQGSGAGILDRWKRISKNIRVDSNDIVAEAFVDCWECFVCPTCNRPVAALTHPLRDMNRGKGYFVESEWSNRRPKLCPMNSILLARLMHPIPDSGDVGAYRKWRWRTP